MLVDLQQQLNDIYGVGAGYDVRDFLITDPRLARYIAGDAMLSSTSESLLVSEDEDGLALSLFLDAELLERLEHADPLTRLEATQLADLWTVVEGISHFVCVAWKARKERPVSLLELELQAEIDKFVSTTLLAHAQGETDLVHRVHERLFGDVSFNPELDREQLRRYRAANEFAARFCHRLRQRLVDDAARTLDELRDFYRLPLTDKISHIHASAWRPR